jgi:hypothetical protein
MTDQTRDFSKPRDKVSFTIDGDLFEAVSVMPAETLMEFAGSYAKAGEAPGDSLEAMRGLLEMVLLPNSYLRIAERMRSKSDPIDINQISELIPWLLEVYGLRPTQRSSSSADGPPAPESGISSTETISGAASTSSISPQTVS